MKSTKCQLLCVLHRHTAHRRMLISYILHRHDSNEQSSEFNLRMDVFMRNRCLGSDYCFSLASRAVFMCGAYIYNGVGCVYSYRGSQMGCLLTNPALPWSPALLPFRPMTSSGRWPPGSRSPMMHLHPDSIKRTLGASGLVLPHQQRGVIPDVEPANRLQVCRDSN